MQYALIGIRFFVAAIFVIAFLGKIMDLSGSRRAVAEFGFPEGLAYWLGTALPFVEGILGVTLLFATTAWWAAIGAEGLLICFILAISANLAFGRRPDCHCFGQIHSEPVGWKTILQNMVLTILLGAVVFNGPQNVGPGVGDVLSSLSITQLVSLSTGTLLLAICAMTTWFMLQLYQQNGRLLHRIEVLESKFSVNLDTTLGSLARSPQALPKVGLPIGTPAPKFSALDVFGRTVTLELLLEANKELMIVFVDPECGPCTALLPKVASWQNIFRDTFNTYVISRNSPKINVEETSKLNVSNILLQKDREISGAFQCYGTPGAVWVRANGTINSFVAQGGHAIEELVNNIRRFATPALGPTPKYGQSIPDIALQNLSGTYLKLVEIIERSTALLFWNPACGFCARILEDLRVWENNRPAGSPDLILVSSGPKEALRNSGLNSVILIDDEFLAGRAFGANGTPSTVLVDEKGLVQSGVLVGGEAILATLGYKKFQEITQENTAS